MKSLFIMPILFPMLRWWTRVLRTDRAAVGRLERLVRGALHAPLMAGFVAAVRVRHVLIGPFEFDATTSRGLRFRCNLSDLIQMYLGIFGEWEPDITLFIESRLREGDAFIDVGANVGWHSLIAARTIGGCGKVAAIEPAEAIHSRLVENIERNALGGRIRAIRAAASDQRGELMLHAGPDWNIGLTSAVPRRGLREAGMVPAAPLGELLLEQEIASAAIIKIDVEGAEDRVLRGMIALLPRLRPDVEILVELSPLWWTMGQSPSSILKPFRDAGFNVYRMENNYWPWRYLWPNAVKPVQRYRGEVEERISRLDIVLSRVDAEELQFTRP